MNNIMEYKGYFAEIKYSDEDGCFYGLLEGLKHASISFEGNSVKELKKEFKNSVDDYILWCKKDGKEPEKQCKGSLNVRLGFDLHKRAKIKAEQKNISINELIKEAVAMYLESA